MFINCNFPVRRTLLSLLFHSFIHSVTYLHKYGVMNFYLVGFVPILQLLQLFILLLKFFQLWPLKAPSRYGLCPFNMLPSFRSLFLLPCAQDALGSSCIFPVPMLESVISPRTFFLWKSHLETQAWAVGILIATGVSSLPGPLIRQH